MPATRNCPVPKEIPMTKGESDRFSAKAIEARPVSKYHAPTATTGRGKNRHDENTPRLKTTCHIPGIIHRAPGTKRTSTNVTNKPTPTDGRNCSTAILNIPAATDKCTRPLRDALP